MGLLHVAGQFAFATQSAAVSFHVVHHEHVPFSRHHRMPLGTAGLASIDGSSAAMHCLL